MVVKLPDLLSIGYYYYKSCGYPTAIVKLGYSIAYITFFFGDFGVFLQCIVQF